MWLDKEEFTNHALLSRVKQSFDAHPSVLSCQIHSTDAYLTLKRDLPNNEGRVEYDFRYHDTWGPILTLNLLLAEGVIAWDLDTVCRLLVPADFKTIVRNGGVGGRPAIHISVSCLDSVNLPAI